MPDPQMPRGLPPPITFPWASPESASIRTRKKTENRFQVFNLGWLSVVSQIGSPSSVRWLLTPDPFILRWSFPRSLARFSIAQERPAWYHARVDQPGGAFMPSRPYARTQYGVSSLLAVILAASSVHAATFTSDTTINAGDTTYDGQDITVSIRGSSGNLQPERGA